MASSATQSTTFLNPIATTAFEDDTTGSPNGNGNGKRYEMTDLNANDTPSPDSREREPPPPEYANAVTDLLSLSRLFPDAKKLVDTLTFISKQNFDLPEGERCFGAVKFPNRNKATYIRCGPQTSPEVLLKSLQRLNYPCPRVLISVTGGALDFEISKELETILKHGLRAAAEATDAWVISGGTNCGIMKFVGDALSSVSQSDSKIIPLIGFATYGIIDNREAMKKSVVADVSLQSNSSLDQNHTHFFLVDNQTEGKFGVEVELKAKFEAMLVNHDTPMTYFDRANSGGDSDRIYSVLLVVEGGPVTLQVVAQAVDNNTPVVVIEGSGRAADLISYAWRLLHCENPSTQFFRVGELRRMVSNTFPTFTKEKMDEMVVTLLNLVTNRTKITLFGVDSAESLDVVMLRAIMTTLRQNNPSLISKYNVALARMKLAVSFDQVDATQRYLLEMLQVSRQFKADITEKINPVRSDGVKLVELFRTFGVNHLSTPPSKEDINAFQQLLSNRFHTDVYGSMLWSLQNNQVEFAQLFMSQLGSVAEFLYSCPRGTAQTHLELLFDPRTRTHQQAYFDVLLKNVRDTVMHGRDLPMMSQIDCLMVRLLYGRDELQLVPRNFQDLLELSKTDKRLASMVALHELMLWAVLMNRYRLAELFWESGNHSVPNALVACRLFGAMASSRVLRVHGNFLEVTEKMARLAKKFESLATGIVEECHAENPDRTRAVLRYPLKMFRLMKTFNGGYLDCIEVALIASDREFLSHPSCLAVLQEDWYGRIHSKVQEISIVLNVLFPFLLLYWGQSSLLSVRVNARDQWSLGTELQDDSQMKVIPDKPLYSGREIMATRKRGHWWKAFTMYATTMKYRILNFFDAPVTKFYLDVVAFIGLLVLYSSIVLQNLPDTYLTFNEILLAIWMFVLMCEEIRQLLMSGIAGWFADSWNRMDLILYCMYMGTFAVRIYSLHTGETDDLVNAKLLYVVNLMQLFVRSMRLYAISSILGPKLIMLRRMVGDVVTFIALFAIFMFSYAMFIYAALHPLEDYSDLNWRDLLYTSFFSLYGFTDGFETSSTCEDHPFQNCGASFGYLIPVVMAFYFIIANIVLVNLLIAMFNTTYNNVEAESMQLWRLQSWGLLTEFGEKPPIPPPLSVFFLLYKLCSAMSGCCPRKGDGNESALKRNSKEEEFDASIDRFEEKHTDRFLAKRKADLEASTEERIVRLDDGLKLLQATVVELHAMGKRQEARLLALLQWSQTHETTLMNVMRRTTTLDHAIGDVEARYYLTERTLMQTLTTASLNYPPPADRHVGKKVLLPSDPSNLRLFNRVLWYKAPGAGAAFDMLITMFQCETHRSALDLLTPWTEDGKVVKRVSVPKDKISWTVELPDYSPMDYTSPYVLAHSPGTPLGFAWAKAETDTNVPVTASVFGDVMLDGDRPRNPIGRTGLRGRGVLGNWGPSFARDLVISRWKVNSSGNRVERGGKPMLEVLCLRRADGSWAVPGAMGTDSEVAIRNIMNKAFGMSDPHLSTSLLNDVKRFHDSLKAQAISIYKGYVDDPRNTDNAWVETEVFHMHDEQGQLSKLEILDNADAAVIDVAWIVAHKRQKLFVEHSDVVNLVVTKLNAFWDDAASTTRGGGGGGGGGGVANNPPPLIIAAQQSTNA